MSYKLKDIVSEYIIEGGGSQLNQFARLYQLAVSGLREFNMNASGITKTEQLPIKVNDTCDLPQDYLQYSKIGLVGSDGMIHSLGRNDNLSMYPVVDDCGGPIPAVNNSVFPEFNQFYGYEYNSTARNGEFMGKIFGIHGGKNPYGDFKIDRERGLVLISGLTLPGAAISVRSVFMEYISDINSVDGDFDVHPFMVEALKNWIYWKLIQRDRNRPGSQVDRALHDYNISKRWAKKRFQTATLQEYVSAFRHGNMAGPKF